MAEGIWAVGFAIAGLIDRRRASHLVFTGSDTVLVVAPHPDDETIGCGLAVSAHVDAGDRVTVAVVTDGQRSRANGLTPMQMRRQRRIEAVAAIAALGAEPRLLHLPEGKWLNDDLTTALAKTLAAVVPTVVYVPSTIDFHPEHRRVAACFAGAMRANGANVREVRVYELQVPLGGRLANAYVVGEPATLCRRRRALELHATQRRSFGWLARRDRYNMMRYGTRAATEVFTVMSVEEYASLVALGSGGQFRGIRPRPLTDPLAWLIGRRTRIRAIRALAPGRRTIDTR